jgi:hypothetical protein
MHRLEKAVDSEVGQRPRAETESHRFATTQLDAIGEQLEAHRADQRPGTEGQHETHESVRPRRHERKQRADHQRHGRKRTPADRRRHTGTFAYGTISTPQCPPPGSRQAPG